MSCVTATIPLAGTLYETPRSDTWDGDRDLGIYVCLRRQGLKVPV